MTETSWRHIIAQNAKERSVYELSLKGKIPPGLQGTLYRNGPGIFKRQDLQRTTLLDGDGMIQSFYVREGKVFYQAAFVKTPKFQAEEKAGHFKWRTWTTNAPGGFLNNIGRIPSNQAGVSVWYKQEKLFAFDESTQPYVLDPHTLETQEKTNFGIQDQKIFYAAHPKWDPETGEWLHFGLSYGFSMHADITIFKKSGALESHRRFKLPWVTYIHDWFVTKNHIIFLIHPVKISIFSFLLGGKTLRDAMSWNPERGNHVWVFPRYGPLGKPKVFETNANWMWHSLNAYEKGQDIVLDFLGYDGPGNFLGHSAPLQLQPKERPQWNPSGLIRYCLSPQKGTLKREVLAFGGNNDFPATNPFGFGRKKHYGYYLHSDNPEHNFFNQLCRFNYQTNAVDSYDFGPDILCLEPVFTTHANDKKDESAFLLMQTQNLKPPFKGALHIFAARNIKDGPLATATLAHASPMSFHGCWVPERRQA